MRSFYRRQFSGRRSAAGLSLIELMISLVLGLVVVGGAIGIFLSNQRTYRATESVARIQESARVSFELMTRDIRETGMSMCGGQVEVANILRGIQGDLWWSGWASGIRVYGGGDALRAPDRAFGLASGQRVNSTDALDLYTMRDSGVVVSEKMPANSANIQTTDGVGKLKENDIVMICDGSQATIFQITGTPGGAKIQKNPGTDNPGNCTKDMGSPVPAKCHEPKPGNLHGTDYLYGPNAVIAYPEGVRWFVGYNGRGNSKSLYRAVLTVKNKTVNESVQEIAQGVTDMKLSYLLPDRVGYHPITPVPPVPPVPWKDVISVRIKLSLDGEEKVGTGGQTLKRDFTNVVTLRNRLP